MQTCGLITVVIVVASICTLNKACCRCNNQGEEEYECSCYNSTNNTCCCKGYCK